MGLAASGRFAPRPHLPKARQTFAAAALVDAWGAAQKRVAMEDEAAAEARQDVADVHVEGGLAVGRRRLAQAVRGHGGEDRLGKHVAQAWTVGRR